MMLTTVERRVAAPAATVFALLTTPAGLVQWWPSSAEIDLRPGGAYHFHWEGPDVHLRGEVISVDPPRLFGFTWSWDHEDVPISTVRVQLSQDSGITTVEVEQTATTEAESADYRSGWEFFLGRLAAVAEAAGAG